jgi:MFS family permease
MPAPSSTPAKTPRALWFLLGLLVLSIFINYIDRANLSVAAPDLRRELALSPADLGLLLGAFFWSYALLQLVAGWLVDRYNVYWAYGIGFLLWSCATALTGFAASFGVLFGLRLVLGAGESIAYPAYSRIIACDFPERHRGIANALLDAGSKAGPALGTMLGFWIMGRFGWRALFFALGFGAMLWLVPWFLASPRSGTANPEGRPAGGSGPGFLDIARKRAAWGTFLVLFCSNYAWYFMLTWLPSYLVEERHFSTAMMTVYGSLPYWGITVMTITGGWFSDRLIARGAPVSRVRKGFAVTGLLLSTLILPASMISDQVLSLGLLVVGCISYGLFSSNVWAITQTLAGPASGKWTGMQNCLGNVSGVLAPYVTGVILQRTGSFYYAFVAVAVALVVGAASYVFIVGKVQPICWDEPCAGGPRLPAAAGYRK